MTVVPVTPAPEIHPSPPSWSPASGGCCLTLCVCLFWWAFWQLLLELLWGLCAAYPCWFKEASLSLAQENVCFFWLLLFVVDLCFIHLVLNIFPLCCSGQLGTQLHNPVYPWTQRIPSASTEFITLLIPFFISEHSCPREFSLPPYPRIILESHFRFCTQSISLIFMWFHLILIFLILVILYERNSHLQYSRCVE